MKRIFVIRPILKLSKNVAIVLLCLSIAGCGDDFTMIDGEQLKARWHESKLDSAVSWWYLGQKNGFHYFVEKYPMSKKGYKVDARQVSVKIKRLRQDTVAVRDRDWVNLKEGDLVFGHQSEKK